MRRSRRGLPRARRKRAVPPGRAIDDRRARRAIPADLDLAAVADIDAALDRIVRDGGVAIPWAIESGSRAWGFPSPDSDHDCRFVYVRPTADSLSIWPRRDVIEVPLVGELDINNPEVCGGRPVVAGTRMRVSDVLEMLAGGASAGRSPRTSSTSANRMCARCWLTRRRRFSV